MLPSRGLVQSSQALRLRQVTPRARCARTFSTAMRSRSGASSMPASGLALGQLSGRRVAAVASTTNSRTAQHTLTPPSSAAAFSLWPFGSSASAAQTSQTAPTTPTTPSQAAAAAPTEFVPETPVAQTAAEAPAYSAPVTDAASSAASSSSSPSHAEFAADPAALHEILDGSALLDMADNQIGYLHALGLDFGWGPTAMCQWALEHIHVYTGLPWWASIIGVATLFRAAIFLPSMTAAEQSAKMQVLRRNPRYAQAMDEMQKMALKGGAAGQAKAMEARLTMKRLQEAMNISMWKMFIPMVNVPFGYGMFRLLRSMGALPVPSLETAGLLWFTDLTVPDPYFVLPVVSAGIMYLIFRTNIKYMAPEQQQTMKWVQMAITPISIIVTIKMSAGVTFFFLSSSLLQLIQTWLWHQPWLRNWKGLPPMHEMLQGGALNNVPGSGASAAQQAARPVAFRVDPNSSWKAPRATSTGAKEADAETASDADAAKKIEQQILTQPPSALESAKKGWDKLMGTAKEKQASSKDKEVLRKAQDYEKRRAMEDDMQMFQRREAERQLRDMKKQLDASKKKNENSKWQ